MLFGAYTLIVGPYRSEVSNIADGMLGVLLGVTMITGYYFEDQDASQSLVVRVVNITVL